MIFEDVQFGQVRTIMSASNEPLFCLADVCTALGMKKFRVERLAKDVISNHPLQTAGGLQQVTFVNEDGLYDIVLDSRKPKAKDFRKWITSKVVPSIRKTGKYELVEKTPQQEALATFDDKKRFIEWSASFLGVNDAGKLMMARKLAAEYGMDKYLPDYVESKGQLHSATYLLKKYGCNFSATTFNTCAHTTGLIKKMERKGKGGITRTWWALDEPGKEFGEDLVSDKCPSQTQIHWYDDKFTQVLDIISAEYVGKGE